MPDGQETDMLAVSSCENERNSSCADPGLVRAYIYSYSLTIRMPGHTASQEEMLYQYHCLNTGPVAAMALSERVPRPTRPQRPDATTNRTSVPEVGLCAFMYSSLK